MAALSYDDIYDHLLVQGYSPAGASGIAQNFERESSGKTDAQGDYTDGRATSIGLGQWHNDRKDALISYAKQNGQDPTDAGAQFAFLDQEMKTKFPGLRKQLMEARDPGEAEESFKRVFERPASIMWSGNGKTLGNSKYSFADWAMKEYDGDPSTSVNYMSPDDYLDLSPPLDGDKYGSASARALRESLESGAQVNSIPTMTIQAQGPTGAVTAQDGRNRALAAKGAGIDAIPVAMKGIGGAAPTELTGMGGKTLPMPGLVPASDVTTKPGAGGSLMGMLGIGSAEAAEPPKDDPWAKFREAPQQPTGSGDAKNDPWAAFRQSPTPDAPATPMSAMERFGTGLKDPIEGGAQLLEHMLPQGASDAVSRFNNKLADMGVPLARIPEGGMDQEVREREAGIKASSPEGTDWARTAGQIASPANLATMTLPGGPLIKSAIAGATAGALQPEDTDSYWSEKFNQTGAGGVFGTAFGMLGKLIAPKVAPEVRELLDAGVELTPGQMAQAGGKRAEEAAKSIPLTGSAIRKAEERAFDTFNLATANKALSPIGVSLPEGISGRAIIDAGQKALSASYNAILPKMTFTADKQFGQDLQALSPKLLELPDSMRQQFVNILKNRLEPHTVGSAQGNSMGGEQIKGVLSEFRHLSSGYKSSSDNQQRLFGQAIDGVTDAIHDALSRQNPKLAAELKKTDAAYAMFVRVEGASARRAGGDGRFTPADLLASVKRSDNSVRKRAFARGDSLLQGWAESANKVISNKLPDSGTPERMMWDVGGAGGAAWYHPHVAAGMLAGMLPYTRPGGNLARSLASPGPVRSTVGGAIKALSPFGAVGASETMGNPFTANPIEQQPEQNQQQQQQPHPISDWRTIPGANRPSWNPNRPEPHDAWRWNDTTGNMERGDPNHRYGGPAANDIPTNANGKPGLIPRATPDYPAKGKGDGSSADRDHMTIDAFLTQREKQDTDEDWKAKQRVKKMYKAYDPYRART